MTIRRPDATRPRHVIALCKYAEERIECECGETITAEPDAVKRDAHLPLIAAWELHKRGGVERVYGNRHRTAVSA